MSTYIVEPPIPRTHNFGPDGKHYPFGWLSDEETRVGDYVLIPCHKVLGEPPSHYVTYRMARGEDVRHMSQSWSDFGSALIAVVMHGAGVDVNAIQHLVPFVRKAISAAAAATHPATADKGEHAPNEGDADA